MRFFLTIHFCFFLSFFSFSQGLMDPKNSTTRQDTLRGSITAERSWWDLNYYHLYSSVKPEKKGKFIQKPRAATSKDNSSYGYSGKPRDVKIKSKYITKKGD